MAVNYQEIKVVQVCISHSFELCDVTGSTSEWTVKCIWTNVEHGTHLKTSLAVGYYLPFFIHHPFYILIISAMEAVLTSIVSQSK